MFTQGTGDWRHYRETLENLVECDFHVGTRRQVSYEEAMAEVASKTLKALQYAQAKGFDFIMFRHGWSTSRLGKTTARSVVRGVMRGKDSTPYVIKSQSIQHESVFIAAIRPGESPVPKGLGIGSFSTVTELVFDADAE